MATLTISLPRQRAQTAFNLRRWEELLADTALAKIEGRIETDRHGHILMSPPPAPQHGSYQSEIVFLLRSLWAWCRQSSSLVSSGLARIHPVFPHLGAISCLISLPQIRPVPGHSPPGVWARSS